MLIIYYKKTYNCLTCPSWQTFLAMVVVEVNTCMRWGWGLTTFPVNMQFHQFVYKNKVESTDTTKWNLTYFIINSWLNKVPFFWLIIIRFECKTLYSMFFFFNYFFFLHISLKLSIQVYFSWKSICCNNISSQTFNILGFAISIKNFKHER